MRTIRKNDTGAAVEDVQQRLRKLGYDLAVDGRFQENTQKAVRAFRASQGLPEGDTIDTKTWEALVDASFSLGDRLLYLRMPNFEGSDVAELQTILGVLGFAVGDAQGVFGVHTESALREFQSSIGLIDEGIAGAATYDAIQRLRHAWEGKSPATEPHEQMGFARAAEALEKMEACCYGMDEMSRHVATRVANLAQATTPYAQVMSADAMGGIPPHTMLMVGISTQDTGSQEGVPVVEMSEDFTFSRRLRTAIQSAPAIPRRVVVEVNPAGIDSDGRVIEDERWEQHLAVILLDALCSALS